ncbi:MAG: tripartite tricarboxylate transporter substrate binding protein [Bdellovibrionales bacterium]|nr:tripartite tricarboxylate transporter substrate binding protein [Ramlibacter sp.]
MNRDSNRREVLRAAVKASAAVAAAWMNLPASAQAAYPNKSLRLIVPQPPGGGFDFVARVLAERLGRPLGQSVVVENRAGSGTLIGTDLAAKAAPDGYTLLLGSVSNLALNMGLYKNLSYDSLRDFEPLGLAVSYSYTLMCRKDLALNSLQEVVAYAKANPGKLSYASAGNGSGQHVVAAALWHLAGVQLTHVPYRGAQPAYQDLVGGRVDLFFDLSSTARVQIDAGTVRPLATSGSGRLANLPNVPTLNESGVKLELESWFGLFAPAKTPPDILERLRKDLAAVIATPEVADIFRKAGGKPLNLTLAETRALVGSDIERLGKLVRELDIKPE